MKRNTYISTIKTQVNSKFSPQGVSDRDFIVFKPKSYIFNPILSKQSTKNIATIYSDKTKKKSQPSLVKVHFKFKQKQENNEPPGKQMQIQRCSTFNKKFRFNKTRYIDSEKSFQIRTPREKVIRTSMEKYSRLRNIAFTQSEKKMKHQFLIGLQKRNIDSFFLTIHNSNLSFQGKQNCPKKFNFHPLRQVVSDDQSIDLNLNRVSLFKERIKQKEKRQMTIPPTLKTTKQIHKRLLTDIPSFAQQRPSQKLTPKNTQNVSCNVSQIHQKKDEIDQFKPWQTVQNFDNHDYILDEDSQCM